MLSQDKDNTKNLITFLRDLANSMENNDISPTQLKRVGEFFMNYKFHEQAVSDITSETVDFTHEEFMKFLCFGWYVYRILSNEEILE